MLFCLAFGNFLPSSLLRIQACNNNLSLLLCSTLVVTIAKYAGQLHLVKPISGDHVG